MGVPEEEARYYDQEFRSGRTLVTVKADGRYDEAQALLRRYGAYDVTSQGGAAAMGDSATVHDRDRIQLREEDLQARKTSVEKGQVSLGKEVVSEERTVEVPVNREEVYVERRAVDRPAERPVGETAGRTLEVPVREERVEVDKQPVVYEEAGIRKQEIVSNQAVSETVRREELRVKREGDAKVEEE
jgi:uncharacterized protein (TIGR02271 family)